MIKMRDIAAAAGVSVMTVSRAFRQDGAVSAERRAAILKVADELGYVFDSTASTLRLGRQRVPKTWRALRARLGRKSAVGRESSR